MGLGEAIKLIYHLIRWQIWAIIQIFSAGRWVYDFIQSRRPPPPPTPFSLTPATWHSHCHIVAGSGHGKTQLLQIVQLLRSDTYY